MKDIIISLIVISIGICVLCSSRNLKLKTKLYRNYVFVIFSIIGGVLWLFDNILASIILALGGIISVLIDLKSFK